jgi:hypothetical protein
MKLNKINDACAGNCSSAVPANVFGTKPPNVGSTQIPVIPKVFDTKKPDKRQRHRRTKPGAIK